MLDVGLLHHLEELPRVGGERFDVPPLAFGVDGIEREGRFTRSADAGNDRQGIVRDFKINILEIVDPDTMNNDALIPCEVRCCSHKPTII